jgi:predicted esterase
VRAFLDAPNPGKARKQIEPVLRTGIDIETLEGLLREGREYSADVERGRLEKTRRARDGRVYPFTVLVPPNYDPARRYPLHVYLHGGIARPAWKRGGGWWRNYDAMENPDRISVFPASWIDAPWWRQSQIDNVDAILDELGRTYNIDENRVHLFGLSDGATGAYYFALRWTTPWASYLPFIGHAAVLANRKESVEGQLHAANLANRPLFIVNGGLDPLYSPASVIPYIRLFEQAGADVNFRFKPEGGHDVSWWPAEAEAIEKFVTEHPRDPLPSRVTWQTEAPRRSGRAFWVVIEKLGKVEGEVDFLPLNEVEEPQKPALGFALQPRDATREGVWVGAVEKGSIADAAGVQEGDRIVRAEGRPADTLEALYAALQDADWGVAVHLTLERDDQRRDVTLRVPPPETRPARAAFPHLQRSGRIVVVQNGNDVTVSTRGVRLYRLLLSGDRFDLGAPVRVETNGAVSFEGRVLPDSKTMLEWAAADDDRTMLFGASLEIDAGVATK